MNDELAETLLKETMGWDAEILTQERLDLQRMSNYKYDEYQQFFPGRRFIENLTLWLQQFVSHDERKVAYDFIKKNLIFISYKELDHIISMTYPDLIESYIAKYLTDNNSAINPNQITKILTSQDFKNVKNQCLFLGLSDGARIDVFRRHSGLNHEQVYPIYLITKNRSDDFLKELIKRLPNDYQNPKFKIAFLIDDFSGSGLSFIRYKNDWKGKLAAFYKSLIDEKIRSELFEEKLLVCVVLYIATKKAKDNIFKLGTSYFQSKDPNIVFDVQVIHEIDDVFKFDPSANPEFSRMIEKKYYDNKIESIESYQVGDLTNPHLGFDGCGLTIIMHHNCPNDSLPILWYDPEAYRYRGLFPRVERFPKE